MCRKVPTLSKPRYIWFCWALVFLPHIRCVRDASFSAPNLGKSQSLKSAKVPWSYYDHIQSVVVSRFVVYGLSLQLAIARVGSPM